MNYSTLKKYWIILLLLIAVFPSFHCSKTNPIDELIPYRIVNFTIDPHGVQYNNLNIVGNYTYVTGGYRGIIIYHASPGEFKAYDRTSTYNFPNPADCRVTVDDTGLLATDTCSNSTYILLDGSPFEGPATLSLKQYRASFDCYLLHVYN